jgi:hypothetical protein
MNGVSVYVGCKKHDNIQDWGRQELNELLNMCRMEIYNQELVMQRPGKRPDADERYLATLKEREQTIRNVIEIKRSQHEATQNGCEAQGQTLSSP